MQGMQAMHILHASDSLTMSRRHIGHLNGMQAGRRSCGAK